MSLELGFYCEDATNDFLPKESVDLFLSHPPYFSTDMQHYGGDLSKQIQNKSQDIYINMYVRSIQNMEKALKHTGSILIILQNNTLSFSVISEIKKNTKLKIDKVIIWNYINSPFIKNISGNEFAIILHLHKGMPFVNRNNTLDNFIIDLPWTFDSDLDKYKDSAFVHDSFPLSLAEKMIRLFTKENDVVADLFAGTGTTCLAAKNNNRKYIYNDVSKDQFAMARIRING